MSKCDSCRYKYTGERGYCEKYSFVIDENCEYYEKMPEHETIEKLREALKTFCGLVSCDEYPCDDCPYLDICKGEGG